MEKPDLSEGATPAFFTFSQLGHGGPASGRSGSIPSRSNFHVSLKVLPCSRSASPFTLAYPP